MTPPEAPLANKATASPGHTREAPPARTYVDFLFFKLSRPSVGTIAATAAREFLTSIKDLGKTMDIRMYSCMGWRSDVDFLLWVITKDPEDVQKVMGAINRTGLGGHLNLAYSYLAMTKPSPYSMMHVQNFEKGPSEHKYLFVYPFTKTHDWYQLPYDQRKKMMTQHLVVSNEFPTVKVNTTYSFGLGDQDFVLAFETDHPQDFLDLVQKLRETEARKYTASDIPLLMCVQKTPEQIMNDLGLSR